MSGRSRAFPVVRHAVLGLWTLIVLFPILWMVMTSFKDAGDWVSWPTRWLPFVDFEPTLLNYRQIFYFGGSIKEGAVDALPAGYAIGENSKTGLPILKKA